MSLCVVAGSYEAFLYGYSVSEAKEGEKKSENEKKEEDDEDGGDGEEVQERRGP